MRDYCVLLFSRGARACTKKPAPRLFEKNTHHGELNAGRAQDASMGLIEGAMVQWMAAYSPFSRLECASVHGSFHQTANLPLTFRAGDCASPGAGRLHVDIVA